MKRTQKFLAWLLVLTVLFSGCGSTVGAEDSRGFPHAAKAEEIITLLSEQETLSDWMIFDLAAYGADVGEDRRQAYIEGAKESVTSQYAAATDFAKAEIIFSKLGEDKSVLGADVSSLLEEQSEFATYSDAVWTLIAASLDTVTLSDELKLTAVGKLSASVNESGMLTGSWGDYVYEDPDSTGAAIGALGSLVNDGDTYGANALYDKMLSALSAAQTESGSFGSACTDAFVIIGLCSAGIDPETDPRFVKGENSLLDGLMSYAVEGGFAGYDGSLDLEWSTEQGLRALIAYRGFTENNGAYNIYFSQSTSDNEDEENNGEGEDVGKDETKNESIGGGLAGSTTQNPSEQKPGGSAESDASASDSSSDSETDKKITVTFELLTHEEEWLSAETVSVKENTTVRDLIKQVFAEHKIGGSGLSTGYLRAVTYNGVTLGEFDAGPMSGWQYYVNGDLPPVGISSYKLSDGDFVSLRYIADYTEDTKHDEEKSEGKKEEKTEDPAKEDDAEVKNVYSDVSESDWFYGSVMKATSLNLMKGVSDTLFSPSQPLTRAMFVTVLHRIEGAPKPSASNVYSDISEKDWFFDAVLWASENGIVNGTAPDRFSPDSAVTREQMATLAYRYAKYKQKESVADGASAFSDSDKISSYAASAVSWASSAGIMTGSDNRFNPEQSSKRSEAAAVFVRLYEKINS